MVLRHLQPCFTGGEISPSLQARQDVTSYQTWLKTAQNMLVHPQGGISNRPGTQYVAGAKYTAKNCRLFSFPINEEESYVVEAGDKYLRFYTASGPVLQANQTVLEFTTPYTQEELAYIKTAQHNQSLYWAHPNHPLMCLTRTALGQFTWQEVSLRFGPFQPVNDDSSKQMRVYPQTSTVESEGVAATLAFEPVNYPNLMVWAYFNDTCFYMSNGFGLNLAEIVQYFNDAYSTQGLTASRQGNILRVSSAAADGGDWNGTTFVLEYRSHFNGPADATATQTLGGGENAGTQTVAQAGHSILESSFDYFTPLHVGGLFSLLHVVDAQYTSGTLGYESVSSSIACGSEWTLRTSGSWTGNLQVEVSSDLGAHWQTVKILSRAEEDENFYVAGNLNDPENLFQVRVRSCQITGDAGYELSAPSFIQRGVVKVESYVSATQVVAQVQCAYGSTAWTHQWAAGSFSPHSGYPTCVFFFQERLGLAGTRSEGQTLWFSKTGKLTDFGHARDTQLATDALSVCLGGTQLNSIQSVVVSNRLLIFTAGSEWTLTCNGALDLDSLQVEQQSAFGAYSTAPVLAGNRALFVQARGSCVRDLVYDYTTSSYASDDLTLRAKHLFFNRNITQLAYTQEPDQVLWCVTDEGKLLTLTYIPQQGIYAWTWQQTQGEVISMCVNPSHGNDEVWWAVRRSNGIFIEKLCPRLQDKNPVNQQFLDSSISFLFQTPHTQLTGLSHLEGENICVLADGQVINELTVQNGSVTLPHSCMVAQAGLAYQSKMVTLPLRNLQKQKYRPVAVWVNMLDSRGGKIGTGDGKLTELVERTWGTNGAIPLQTTEVKIHVEASHQRAPEIVVEQNQPLPLTVLAIGVEAA